ncbi:MAG TPA: GNAT family N-acetyltransferase [Nitrospiraceae bacterium]|nr:GNAT family N-acetyltransferase [Nitrospiraceae bacterium]
MTRRPVGKLTFHEVDAEHWNDFERLFEAKGSPHYCWCMAWRATPEEIKLDGPGRKIAMYGRVQAGTPVGLLGYLGHEPVAWCSIAPRRTFRGLISGDPPDEGIWSITCFFVLRQLRRAGIAKQLLAAALRHAREHGAKVVEAYPVEADSPSYRHMGFVPMFEEAGFREVGREGTRRHVMQRKLRVRAR